MAALSPPSASLRVRVLLLVLLTLLPSLLLALYTGAEQRALAVAQAHAEALRLARLAATHHDRSIETTRQLLATLARLVQARQINPSNCAALLGDVLGQHSIYANLGLIDRSGQLICSAVPVSGSPDLSDRTYFQRTLSTGGFAAGDYQIGRITNQASVNFGYPVSDGSGNIEAVIFAALNLAFFQDLAADVRLPAGAVLTVVDQSGTILARYPNAANWVGQALPETPIVSTVVSQQAEGTAHTTGLDGVMRLYAFTPLRGALEAGYLYIGVPDEVAFAGARRLLAVNLSGLALTGLLALAAAWAFSGALILRPIAGLLRSARRVAAGDLAARAGPPYASGELGELSQVFDDMAGSLQQREAERQQAETEIRYQAARAEALARVAARLNARHDLPEVLRLVCTEVSQALSTDAAVVALHEPRRAAFSLAAHCGLPAAEREDQGLIARALAEAYARREERLLVIPDARRLIQTAQAGPGGASLIRTLVSASLWRESDLVGALCLITLARPRSFSADELALLRGLADQAAQAITNARLFGETDQHLRRLAALRSIDQSISASLDLRVTLTVLLEQATAQLGVDAADVLLVNPYAHTLEYAAGRGFRTDALRHTRLRIGRGYAGRAALERRMIAIPNWDEEEPDFSRAPLLPEEGFRAYYGVPLMAKGQVEGVLELFHRAPLSPDAEWLDFLGILAGQAAIAIDNARLFESLQRSNRELVLAYDTTIEGWSRALDLRYDQEEGHAQRVTDLTVQLAQALGTDPAELIHIRRGALLHDVGNLRVPDSILLKTGPLTDDERRTVEQHPTFAYELLAPILFLRRALDIPYCHHERWDGSGYPRGLKGEQIPLPARAFAVVDVWDALSSERPFREPWPRERIYDHLDKQAGRQFDASVVRVFLDQVLAGLDDAG